MKPYRASIHLSTLKSSPSFCSLYALRTWFPGAARCMCHISNKIQMFRANTHWFTVIYTEVHPSIHEGSWCFPCFPAWFQSRELSFPQHLFSTMICQKVSRSGMGGGMNWNEAVFYNQMVLLSAEHGALILYTISDLCFMGFCGGAEMALR